MNTCFGATPEDIEEGRGFDTLGAESDVAAGRAAPEEGRDFTEEFGAGIVLVDGFDGDAGAVLVMAARTLVVSLCERQGEALVINSVLEMRIDRTVSPRLPTLGSSVPFLFSVTPPAFRILS